MSEEMSPVVSQHVDLLLALARLEGKVDAYSMNSTRHDDAQTKTNAEMAALRDRVVAIESSRSASPPWYTTLGAVVPSIGLLLLVAERLYGK